MERCGGTRLSAASFALTIALLPASEALAAPGTLRHDSIRTVGSKDRQLEPRTTSARHLVRVTILLKLPDGLLRAAVARRADLSVAPNARTREALRRAPTRSALVYSRVQERRRQAALHALGGRSNIGP